MCGLSHYFSVVMAPPLQLHHQNEPSDRPLDWMDSSCVICGVLYMTFLTAKESLPDEVVESVCHCQHLLTGNGTRKYKIH